jgi:hypothetical protein
MSLVNIGKYHLIKSKINRIKIKQGSFDTHILNILYTPHNNYFSQVQIYTITYYDNKLLLKDIDNIIDCNLDKESVELIKKLKE